MHYKLPQGIVIKSENAAKPHLQRSKFLDDFISCMPPVEETFDLGCGKLRYLESISRVSKIVTLFDSEIQLSRNQILLGKMTNVREMFHGSNAINCFNIDQFAECDRSFDRGFCLNVFPIVPFEDERQRIARIARKRLRLGASCWFVHHYNNKEYRKIRQSSAAFPFNDGYVTKSLRGFSFFAILKPDYILSLLSSCGFEAYRRRSVNGSCYIEAIAR